MKTKGLKLACLYSFGCQQIKNRKAERVFLKFLKSQNAKKEEITFIVKILKDLHPFSTYRYIRDIKKGLKKQKNLFAESVVRPYWLGNRRLKPRKLNHNFATLARFRDINTDEHVPDWMIKKMLDCAVSFGEVIKVSHKKAEVLNHRLLYQEGKVIFEKETREVNIRFVSNLQEGDLVSIHLAIAREKISNAQAKTLKIITAEAIKALQIA